MIKPAKILANFFTILVFCLVLSGCFPKLSGEENLGTNEYLKGKLVEGFPGVPLYKDAQVAESYGYKGNFGATFITSDKLNKVVGFYNQSFGVAGWDSSLSQKSSDNFEFRIKNAASDGSVVVNTASDGKSTAITISVSAR